MNKLLEHLKKKPVLISDGAWGTQLQAKGLPAGECPERWNLTHRDVVYSVAKGYADAGADMVETNSFGGSVIKLKSYGLDDQTFEINRLAAEISREAIGPEGIVLGSIGPTGKILLMGEITPEEIYEAFVPQVKGLEIGGADAAMIETMMDIEEAKIALRAVRDHTQMAAICSFTFDKTGMDEYRTMMGFSPADVAKAMVEAGADVIGANCGHGMEQMVPIARELKENVPDMPLLIQANAGEPHIHGDKTVFPETPEETVKYVPMLYEIGVKIIGGCCGTTPDHIREIRKKIQELNG
ncbi:MAG TPA: methionine synthase [Bacteroidetes bacterium]|nr:methionine synthase [Bacteroidota bacterium]